MNSTAKTLDVFDKIDLDIFDTLEDKKLKDYIPPPKVTLSLSDEIRSLIQSEIAGSIKAAVAEAVSKIKPRTIETKVVEKITEKIIPTPEKIIEKHVLDDAKLQKAIDAKIKQATDDLFIPAPTLIPSMAGQAGKVLSTNGVNPQWVTASTGTASGSSDAYTANNVSTQRVFDATNTSMDELANVLGSLIVSLQGAKIIQ